MKRNLYHLFFLCFAIIWNTVATAQLPVCSGPGSGLIYYVSGNSIYNYDPTQPLSSSNPSLNTIAMPSSAIQCLAVNNNLNAASPSPTFYTIGSNGNFYYYDGVGWTNTGHNAGGNVNIGGAGAYIYNMNSGGSVYKYDGTTNATFLINVPSPSACVADVIGDNTGNFYLINPQTTQWLKEFNSSGTLLNTWTMSGSTSSSGGGGFAYIGNNVYYNNGSGLWAGVVSGSNIAFTLVTSSGLNPGPSDFASCPLGALGQLSASLDTAYYCAGGPGTLVYANGAGPYTWTVLSGPAVITGSGDSIYLTSTANSTIVLSSGSAANADTVTLIVNPVPVITAGGNISICTGNALNLTASSSPAASIYHWSGPGGFSNNSQNPVINNVVLADSGYYYVSDTLNDCYSRDSLYVTTKRTPSTPVITSNSPICAGDTLKLVATDTTTGITYSWTGPSSFTSIISNPIKANAQSANSGVYTVTVTLNGCSSSATAAANVNSLLGPPIISISSSPDTICVGSNATFSSTVSNASTPVYHWKKNGNPFGPNSASFTSSNITNGDIITCEVSSSTMCQPVDSGLSNALTLHVLILPPPVISLTQFPLTYSLGDTVTFTGHVPNGSTGLLYSWTKNGMLIPGAATPFYTTHNLVPGDTICFIVHSSVSCTFPDSSVVCRGISMGINSVDGRSLHIYPNPVRDELIIEGLESGCLLNIYNMIGQLVFAGKAGSSKEIINTHQFVAGSYILVILDGDGNRDIHKITK